MKALLDPTNKTRNPYFDLFSTFFKKSYFADFSHVVLQELSTKCSIYPQVSPPQAAHFDIKDLIHA